MYRRPFFLVLLLPTLCSCAIAPTTPVTFAPSPSKSRKIVLHHQYHDRLRSNAETSSSPQITPRATDPEQRNDERARVLTTLRPYSAAWWAVHDEIEADNDKRLNRKLVIYRGCLTPQAKEDQTGSIPGK
jgi:hypothetical protein